MECKRCHTPITETTTVCPGCGALIDYNRSTEHFKEEVSPKKPFPIQIVVVLAVVIVLGIGSYYFLNLTPKQQLFKLLEKEASTYIKQQEDEKQANYYTNFFKNNVVKLTGRGTLNYQARTEGGQLTPTLSDAKVAVDATISQSTREALFTLVAEENNQVITNVDSIVNPDKLYFKINGINDHYYFIDSDFSAFFDQGLTKEDREYLVAKGKNSLKSAVNKDWIQKQKEAITIGTESSKVKTLEIKLNQDQMKTLALQLTTDLKNDPKSMEILRKKQQAENPTWNITDQDVIETLNSYTDSINEGDSQVIKLSVKGMNQFAKLEITTTKSGQVTTRSYGKLGNTVEKRQEQDGKPILNVTYVEKKANEYDFEAELTGDQKVKGTIQKTANHLKQTYTVETKQSRTTYEQTIETTERAKNHEYNTTYIWKVKGLDKVIDVSLDINAKDLKNFPNYVIDKSTNTREFTEEEKQQLEQNIKNLPVLREIESVKTWKLFR